MTNVNKLFIAQITNFTVKVTNTYNMTDIVFDQQSALHFKGWLS